LLAIAQHRKNKNLDLLIRAFERLRRHESMSGLRLLIVGSDGPETASLHALVAELSIDQEVIFDSGLSEQELWWAYDHALATVVTSQQEGFCLPLVEALQRGRRVVCSDIPVLREVAGDAAAYFPLAGGEASLAEAILSALQSPPLAPLTRLDRYSFDANGLAYLAVYFRLLEARSRRSRSISLPLPRRTQLSRRPVRNSSLAAEAENEQPAKKLRVLMLHNRYLWPGGEDTAMRADIRLLEHFGNTVELMEFRNEHITTFAEKIKTAVNSVYSRRIRSAVETRIEQFKPDFIHVHNPFPGLTPAVYFAANSLGVPVVQTLHNFRLVCPAATCFRDNAVCELCVGKKFPLPGVVHGCYRNSRSGTLILGSMTAIHQMLGTWRQRVQIFVAVSEFLRRKFWDAGLSLAPIEVKPNCVFDSGIGSGSGGYVLFVGRLDKGKGLEHLLQAWPRVQGARHLAIVGDGPLRDLVKTAAAANSTIRWMGWKSGEEVRRLMKEATLLVFPSESYETFGMPILEAFAAGTPVVASAIGALPELVTHGETGMLVPPASPEALAEAMQGLLVSGKAEQMRPAARRRYESHYSIEQNYAQLCAIDARAASRAAARPPLDRLPQAA
jgi:glycosyltransferase involved in cell wall biosynthesis